MTDQELHDLAVAYAQVKLLKHLQEYPTDSGYDKEFRIFLKWYKSALINLPEEEADFDIDSIL